MYAAQVIKKPDSVLGFATGSTPIPTYKSIIELYNEGVVDFSKVTTFNLDEYSGLDGTHDQSYRYFMMQNLFNHINVRKEAINIINGNSGDDEKACKEYEERINLSLIHICFRHSEGSGCDDSGWGTSKL